MKVNWKYRLGDLLAGATIGGVVALTHHLLVPQSLGVVGGVFLGMFVGMGAQMLFAIFLGSLLGQIEVMVPGMFVGMLGMILPMFRLQDLNLKGELFVGGAIGFVIFLGFAIWDAGVLGIPQRIWPPDTSQRVDGPSAGSGSGPGWLYDALETAGSRRHAPFQRELFRKMNGRVLFVAAGTGLNFAHFPPGREIVAIDLSSRMLEAARATADKYDGYLSLREADTQQLPFPDESFDTAATASTFCSVPDPAQGLKELYRVLKPGGTLLMFEHVRSRNPLVGAELDLFTLATRYIGPAMNRDTVGNTQRAGFVIDRVVCAYLDVFVAIEAHKPAS